MSEDKKYYHIQLSKSDIKGALTVILPGDPGRVEPIAKALDVNAFKLAVNREYTSFLAVVNDRPILICSTGIGGPSTAIAIEELAQIGIQNFIRIGTTGAIQSHINVGEIIISTASVRLDGTSQHYAPLAYPAVSDFSLTERLVSAANKRKLNYHLGITASSDTFYPGQERYDSFSGYVPRDFQGSLKEWQQLNVLNYEMESSALFVTTSTFGLKSAAIYAVIANRTQSEVPNHAVYQSAIDQCIQVIKDAP